MFGNNVATMQAAASTFGCVFVGCPSRVVRKGTQHEAKLFVCSTMLRQANLWNICLQFGGGGVGEEGDKIVGTKGYDCIGTCLGRAEGWTRALSWLNWLATFYFDIPC